MPTCTLPRGTRRRVASRVARAVAVIAASCSFAPAGTTRADDDARANPREGRIERERIGPDRRGAWTAWMDVTIDWRFRAPRSLHELVRRGPGGAAVPPARLPGLRGRPADFRLHESGWVVTSAPEGSLVFAPDRDEGEGRPDLHVTSASRFLRAGFLSVGVERSPDGPTIRIAWAPLGPQGLGPAIEMARLAAGRSPDATLAEAHVRAEERKGGVEVTWAVPGSKGLSFGAARWNAATSAVASMDAARTVRVAAVQCPSDLGETERNLGRIEALVGDAACAGAKFVVLPETAVHGYLSQDLRTVWRVPGRPIADAFPNGRDPAAAAEGANGPSVQRLRRLAGRWGVYLTAPILEVGGHRGGDPRYFNSVVLLGPDGSFRERYRKLRPWPHPEQSWATPGDVGIVSAHTPYGRVGLAVCFDVHEVFAMYAKAEQRPWALLYPIAWVSDGDDEEWFGVELPRRVREAGFHVIGANWSTDAPQPWHGAGFSEVIRSDGTVLAQARTRVGSEVVVADLVPAE